MNQKNINAMLEVIEKSLDSLKKLSSTTDKEIISSNIPLWVDFWIMKKALRLVSTWKSRSKRIEELNEYSEYNRKSYYYGNEFRHNLDFKSLYKRYLPILSESFIQFYIKDIHWQLIDIVSFFKYPYIANIQKNLTSFWSLKFREVSHFNLSLLESKYRERIQLLEILNNSSLKVAFIEVGPEETLPEDLSELLNILLDMGYVIKQTEEYRLYEHPSERWTKDEIKEVRWEQYTIYLLIPFWL